MYIMLPFSFIQLSISVLFSLKKQEKMTFVSIFEKNQLKCTNNVARGDCLRK